MADVELTDLHDSFRRILREHRRVAIAGGPRCGKTTLATFAKKQIADRKVFLHDDFKVFEWAAVPHAMIGAAQKHSAFVIEGVSVARMLRKAEQLKLPCPVDAVVYLQKPHVPRIKGQISMAKGIHKIFKEWRQMRPDVPLYVI